MPLAGSPMSKSSYLGDKESMAHKSFMVKINTEFSFLFPGHKAQRPPFLDRPAGGACWQSPGGQACTHWAQPHTAQKGIVGAHSHWLTNCWWDQRGQVPCELSTCQRRGTWRFKSPAPEASSRDMECNLSGREGARAGVRGRAIPT